jgi:hypothetical protein
MDHVAFLQAYGELTPLVMGRRCLLWVIQTSRHLRVIPIKAEAQLTVNMHLWTPSHTKLIKRTAFYPEV